MPGRRLPVCWIGGVPQQDGAVAVAAGEHLAVGTERKRLGLLRAVVAGRDPSRTMRVAHIVEFDPTPRSGGGHESPVRRRGQRDDALPAVQHRRVGRDEGAEQRVADIRCRGQAVRREQQLRGEGGLRRAKHLGGVGDVLCGGDVALTGRREAYYMDFKGSPQELISAMKWGYLFQGQPFKWRKKGRGSPAFVKITECRLHRDTSQLISLKCSRKISPTW